MPKETGILRKFVFKKPLAERITFGTGRINAKNIVVRVNGKVEKSPDKFGVWLKKGTKEFIVMIRNEPFEQR